MALTRTMTLPLLATLEALKAFPDNLELQAVGSLLLSWLHDSTNQHAVNRCDADYNLK